MKKIQFLALCALAAGLVTSCQKDELVQTNQTQTSSKNLSKAHIQLLNEAVVNPLNAEYITVSHLGDESYEAIKSGDIVLPIQNLEENLYSLAQAEDGQKQYRTNNLVSQGRSISVIGYTGSCCALTSKMKTGLQWAVANYNRVNTSLSFTLTFAASTNADMVIYNAGTNDAGGEAEFPSGGRPGKYVKIFGGMNNYNDNVNEHVMTHEMGHALGFRHTDYALRRCDGINEGTAGSIGAVSIPGTPTANRWGQSGLDTDSIMISCFDGSEDGEFSYYDTVALEYLY